jgi:hypothetical protein
MAASPGAEERPLLEFLTKQCSEDYKTNSGALVRQRTIPTERPPLVGEASANFSG